MSFCKESDTEVKLMSADPLINLAGWYDPLFEGFLGGLRELAARVAPPKPGMKVLDVGCGTGRQLVHYREAGCRVFGIDSSQPMLRVAESNLGERAGLTAGDALRMPFPDQAFDLVISSLFLHQISPHLRTAVLEEAGRVIQPGGQILLIDFHSQDKRSPAGFLTYIFISMIELFAGWEHFSNSRDFLARGGIPPLAADQGLKNRKSIVVGNGNLGIYLLKKL